jgi:hypothetical protein
MIFNYNVKHLFFLGLIVSFLCAGCVLKTLNTSTTSKNSITTNSVSNKGDQNYPDGYYIHKVKFPDESISIIAQWFTGNLKNWKVLAKCNPRINPNRIFLGDVIRIPRILMTRQDPITHEFVEQAQPGPKRIQAKKPLRSRDTLVHTEATPKAVEEEELRLFGPKEYPTN